METELVAIPDDALADALRRLPAQSLAAARCVCKAWRGIVDDRGLLLPHLLPHSVRGIFINYIDHHRPHLFSRPSSSSSAAGPEIDTTLSFLPNDGWWTVMDHCDGLLVCDVKRESHLCVCNPATKRWTLLPPREGLRGYAGAHLMFDPAVSPHYEVVLIPAVPKKPLPPDHWNWKVKKKKPEIDEDEEPDDPYRLMEWPPSPWQLNVFSSRTGQWEARSFVREGEPVGTVEEMRSVRGMRRCRSVYQNGVLYVHCREYFIMRLSLSSDKYRVINTPKNIAKEKSYLGRSENEVCFGFVDKGQLEVWILKESCGEMEWVLRYQDDLSGYAHQVISLYRYNNGMVMAGPWTVEEEQNASSHNSDDSTAETLSEDGFEWDSDNDDTVSVNVNVGGEENYRDNFIDVILGFHPYKKIVYLAEPFRVVAYHMNISKAQYLGYSRPDCYCFNYSNGIYESFVYTPCMIGELQEDNNGQSSTDYSSDVIDECYICRSKRYMYKGMQKLIWKLHNPIIQYPLCAVEIINSEFEWLFVCPCAPDPRMA